MLVVNKVLGWLNPMDRFRAIQDESKLKKQVILGSIFGAVQLAVGMWLINQDQELTGKTLSNTFSKNDAVKDKARSQELLSKVLLGIGIILVLSACDTISRCSAKFGVYRGGKIKEREQQCIQEERPFCATGVEVGVGNAPSSFPSTNLSTFKPEIAEQPSMSSMRS